MTSGDMIRLEVLPIEKEFEVWTSFTRQGLMQAIGAEMVVLGPGHCIVAHPFSDAIGQQGFFHGELIGAVAEHSRRLRSSQPLTPWQRCRDPGV